MLWIQEDDRFTLAGPSLIFFIWSLYFRSSASSLAVFLSIDSALASTYVKGNEVNKGKTRQNYKIEIRCSFTERTTQWHHPVNQSTKVTQHKSQVYDGHSHYNGRWNDAPQHTLRPHTSAFPGHLKIGDSRGYLLLKTGRMRWRQEHSRRKQQWVNCKHSLIILTFPMQSERFGGASFPLPRPNILFILKTLLGPKPFWFHFKKNKAASDLKGSCSQKTPGSNEEREKDAIGRPGGQ